ncbi:nuclear factor 7, ovary-like [Hyperolius riggenbachi]|uniref:nuclear factor 7, ovary-like n=1 Tax=Hyperolius riggenbachi TaxID=752182 RepID=UPI0035A2CC18
MASADLRQELICPVCWEIYIDPVNLKCGHSFCQDCIIRQLLTQKGSGGYSCPQCQEAFQEWPALHRNIALRNVAEHFLTKPSTSLKSRRCSVHKLELKHYCSTDAACICDQCSEEEHQDHQVEPLEDASEKKKKELRDVRQKLSTRREAAEGRVQSLQERRKKVQEKNDGEAERVTALFRDLKRQLEDLEKRILNELSKEAERISGLISDLVDQLVIRQGELSRKMRDIEHELCRMTDPLTVLQELDTSEFCDAEEEVNEDQERLDGQLRDGGDLDVAGISRTLRTGVSHITGANVCFYIQEAADLLLEENTAHNDLHISEDRKTASYAPNQQHPEAPERFHWFTQVLSSQSFSCGRHYWEVDVERSEYWSIGMCYPSIDREGYQSQIECNKKSWCLRRSYDRYSVIHDGEWVWVHDNISIERVRIYLDYEAGTLSFYALCDPIRLLHTFSATFTEPLHAALRLWNGCVKISGGRQEV